MTRSILLGMAALVPLVPPVVPIASATPPEVPRVDLPSWWPRHPIDPARQAAPGRRVLVVKQFP